MRLNQWIPADRARVRPDDGYELLFIDRNNQICTMQLQGRELNRLPAHSQPLALRLTQARPEPERVVAVRYWDYQRGRLWPLDSPVPPDPRGPFLQLLFLDSGAGEIRMEYRAAQAGQWTEHQTSR